MNSSASFLRSLLRLVVVSARAWRATASTVLVQLAGSSAMRRATSSRIRAGIDRLFFVLVLVVFGFVVLVLGVGLELDLGRILRLRDHVGRIRIDEADHQVDQARLAGLDQLVGLQQVLVRGRVAWRARSAPRPGLPRCAWRCGSRLRGSAARPCPSRACTCAPDRWCGRARRRARPAPRRLPRSPRRRPASRLAGEQRLGVRCLFVHRNAHVVDRVDDVFDLLRIDDLGRQVVVDLRVGQVALLLAAAISSLSCDWRSSGRPLPRRGSACGCARVRRRPCATQQPCRLAPSGAVLACGAALPGVQHRLDLACGSADCSGCGRDATRRCTGALLRCALLAAAAAPRAAGLRARRGRLRAAACVSWRL